MASRRGHSNAPVGVGYEERTLSYRLQGIWTFKIVQFVGPSSCILFPVIVHNSLTIEKQKL